MKKFFVALTIVTGLMAYAMFFRNWNPGVEIGTAALIGLLVGFVGIVTTK
jgi:hypothetical protein